MVCTRADIAYALSILTQAFSAPKYVYWESAKRVLEYLEGTSNFGLVLGGNNDNAYDTLTRKSMGGLLRSKKKAKNMFGHAWLLAEA